MKSVFFICAVSFVIIGYSCSNKSASLQSEEPAFVHTVFFWLNDSVTSDDRSEFEKGLVELGTVPSIGTYYYGKPAGTPRDVVDNSYDYAWIVHFPDAAAQDAYQEDPIHLKFIEKFDHLWREVKVFDTVLETGK